MLSFQSHDLDSMKLMRSNEFFHPGDPLPERHSREAQNRREARRIREEARRQAAVRRAQQPKLIQRFRGARRRA